MDERLAKEVKRLKGDEKYFKNFTTDEQVYKVLGVLEVSNTWEEFKTLHQRVKPLPIISMRKIQPDGYDSVLINIFKKGKPQK